MTGKIERQFVTIAEGQAHLRLCGDPALPPLVMFHGSPGSSYSLMPLALALSKQRRVYAIDTLGNGDSSPAAMETPDIPYLADAHMRVIDALGLGQVDLYGYHTGAAICTELSGTRPDRIRRILMDGVSVFDPNASADLLKNDHAPPIPIDYEGTQLMKAWSMVRDAWLFWPWWAHGHDRRRPLGLPSKEYLHFEVLEVLKAPETYYKSYRAALNYPKRAKLPLVANPVLVCGAPSDQLFDHMDRAVALIPGAQKAETPERLEPADLEATAAIMLKFLG